MLSATTRRASSRRVWPRPPGSTVWSRPMVDLVKIRKKAKKKEETEAAARATVPTTAAPPSEPVSAPTESLTAVEASIPPASASREEQSASLEKPTAASEPSSKLDRFKAEAGKRRAVDRGAVSEEASKSQ